MDTGTEAATDAATDVTPPTDNGPADTGPSDTGPGDTGPTDSGPADSGCSGVTLTVKNYRFWCSVTVGTGTASTADVQTVCVPAGTVNLSASGAGSFILGDWHHTSGDTGSGDPGTISAGVSHTTVNASGTSTCVWICCPFPDGTGCPTTDQCP
jgi:hypothetical protein